LREENDFLRSISSRDAIEAHGKPVNWMLRKLMFDKCIKEGIGQRIAYYAAMGFMLKEAGKWTPPKQGPYAHIFNGDEEE
jgi:UDP-N-acetyl-D-mannosaminuronic acid transferase (WecB/TagA/CpsF family)